VSPHDSGTVWLSPEQVAERLHLSRKAIYGAIRRGELAAFKVCGRWMIPEQNVEPWITGSSEPSFAPVQGRTPRPPERGSLAALRAIERESA
jgi:excisionase family DNA binding protein